MCQVLTVFDVLDCSRRLMEWQTKKQPWIHRRSAAYLHCTSDVTATSVPAPLARVILVRQTLCDSFTAEIYKNKMLQRRTRRSSGEVRIPTDNGHWLLVTGYWCLTSLNIAEMISDNGQAACLLFMSPSFPGWAESIRHASVAAQSRPRCGFARIAAVVVSTRPPSSPALTSDDISTPIIGRHRPLGRVLWCGRCCQ